MQVFIEPFNFSFFSVTGWDLGLDYCDIEWFALETNRDHSVIFEIASKYCISDSFVDHDGYSISSEGFLPAVVDIMLYGMRFVTLYRRQGSRPSPWKRNAKKQNGCLGRAYK